MIKEKKYEITKENLSAHELIGLKVKVIKSSDNARIGISGIIVDETQNTLKIQGKHNGKQKEFIIPKKECEFEFEIGDEKVIIKGNEIAKRPQDRTKDWRN